MGEGDRCPWWVFSVHIQPHLLYLNPAGALHCIEEVAEGKIPFFDDVTLMNFQFLTPLKQIVSKDIVDSRVVLLGLSV